MTGTEPPMMEVVHGHCGRSRHLRRLGKPIAGKTGTTNDEKDVCSSASPDLVVGVFRGYMPRYRDCVPAARWRP